MRKWWLSMMFQGDIFLALGVLILIFIYAGVIIIVVSIIYKLIEFIVNIRRQREKTDYMNLNWLKHQYFDLGKNIQDIAEDQNTTIIKIKRWVDKLENYSDN